jgi:hypothetical protein
VYGARGNPHHTPEPVSIAKQAGGCALQSRALYPPERGQQTIKDIWHRLRQRNQLLETRCVFVLECPDRQNEHRAWRRVFEGRVAERRRMLTGNSQAVQVRSQSEIGTK